MKRVNVRAVAIAITTAWIGTAANADELYAYPPEGRSKTQQQKDQFECHQWAVEQTKFDPVQVAAQGLPVQSAPAASVASEKSPAPEARGADGRALVGGAAQGAAVAAVSGGDAGEGAAAGAALRVLREKRAQYAAAEARAQSQQKARVEAQMQAERQKAQNAEDLRSRQRAYQKARGVCFKARGYTVSED